MKVTIKEREIVRKVYLNDEDVTNRCFEADDQEGYIMQHKKENDNYVLTYDSKIGDWIVASEKVTGNVKIELIEE
jgi:hypothetical protein